ncbi:sporulation histidine kinase inhibitor Sda [Paenibacillus enshidis]|uniref:Sporulation histidine kinase inhibitor Sda n=1 Tax=Paenibacillus enshidis TaxID=1458439 RepID=A0ABV5AUW3_9BACL
MGMLTDEMLLESYHLAIELDLEDDFISLLLAEIYRRNLTITDYSLH